MREEKGLELPAVATADASRGLIHRDLKPAYIFLSCGQRRARIGDFGLAKAFDVASCRLDSSRSHGCDKSKPRRNGPRNKAAARHRQSKYLKRMMQARALKASFRPIFLPSS